MVHGLDTDMLSLHQRNHPQVLAAVDSDTRSTSIYASNQICYHEEENTMPLRDHFHPPLTSVASWEELHGQWPAVIVQQLRKHLPSGYVSAPRVHAGAQVEIDVAAYEKHEAPATFGNSDRDGGVATAVWAPPVPSVAVETDLPEDDEYEVRIYDAERGRTLVAAIEIVSPANKDRPEKRNVFVAKCAALLRNGVAVSIVDLVTLICTSS